MASINLFGLIRVTKGFLPLIREAQGRVVNVASMLGRMGAYGRSPYCATKFAVEAVSDCLRLEMKKFNVDVILEFFNKFLIRYYVLLLSFVIRLR